MMKRLLLGPVAALLLCACAAVATTKAGYSGVPCGPPIQSVCEAAAIPDEDARREALLTTIGHALESSDPGVRTEGFRYLALLGRSFDARPLRRAFERFDAQEADDAGRRLLAMADLRYASKSERLSTYRRAIAEGEILLSGVRPLPRALAMQMAADEGLTELKDLIAEYYAMLSAEEQTIVKRDVLLVSIDLRGGADDRYEAGPIAVTRLRDMSTTKLAERVEDSVAWREAVSALAIEVCANRVSSPCRGMREVYIQLAGHFAELNEQRIKELRQQGPVRGSITLTEKERDRGEWLSKVGQTTR